MDTIWNGRTSLLTSALQVLGATWCAIERTPSAVLLTAQNEHYTAAVAINGEIWDALPAEWGELGADGRELYPWASLYRDVMLAQDTVTIDGRTYPRVALAVAHGLARLRRRPHFVTLGHVRYPNGAPRLYLVDAGMFVHCDAVAGEA